MDYCDKNPMNHLDDSEILKKLRLKSITMSSHMLYMITLASIGSCSFLRF